MRLRPLALCGSVSLVLGACTALDGLDDEDGCGDEVHDPGGYASLRQAVIQPGTFTFATLDIGQGDAAVVVAPSGCAALFDGGPTGSGRTIKANLASLGVSRLDFAVVSHYHADHVGGLDEVEQGADGVPIAIAYDRGGSYASLAFDQYASQFSGRRVAVTSGTILSLCDEVSVAVVAADANGVSTSNENARSVTAKLSYGPFDALVGGDLTGQSPDLESLIAGSLGEVELYKVHHHGSATSSNATLLAALRPTVAFLSVGASNSYGHPASSTLDGLAGVGSQVWQTEDPATGAKLGPIVLSTATGASYAVEQGARAAEYAAKGLLDVTPPTAPSSLSATAVSSTRIDLSWQPSTDDVGVTGYQVRRSLDGVSFAPIADVAAPGWSDTGIGAGTTYTYVVAAVDAAGNVSAQSGAAAARTLDASDTTAPTAPAGLVATASFSGVTLSWAAAADDVGVTRYTVWRDGALLAEAPATSYLDTAVAPDVTYVYRVVAHDAAGNASAPSDPAQATAACSAIITSLSWHAGKKELTVKASCSRSTSTITVAGDGATLGTMVFDKGLYTFKKRLAARPACVSIAAACGGASSSCF